MIQLLVLHFCEVLNKTARRRSCISGCYCKENGFNLRIHIGFNHEKNFPVFSHAMTICFRDRIVPIRYVM